MAVNQDILLGDDLDVRIENGDFVAGPSDDLHGQLLLLSKPRDWKPVPWLGVDIGKHLHGLEDADALKGDIRKQFNLDGYDVKQIDLSKGIEGIKVTTALKDE